MAYKVLVVDDEPSNLHVMRTILQDQYTLIFAKSGERAIELTMQQKPDLILLDIMMPGMNGYEVCRILKKERTVSHIPIVIVSALDEYQSEVEGLKSGAVDFLIKPVSPELVKSRVGHLLGEARATAMRENYQLVMNQIAAVAALHNNEVEISAPRIAQCCEWLAIKYGLTKAKAEDISLAYPLCALGELWDDEGGNSTPDCRSMLLLSEATNGFASVSVSLLTYKNTRWDGSGFPEIEGDKIPEECRVAIAAELLDKAIEGCDGNIEERVQRGINALTQEAGTLIDPRIIHLIDEHSDELTGLYREWLHNPWPTPILPINEF
ncbi:diguanylate cyclase [Enterovibrio norvegicus]|uniref:PleD family two-component system response regulator n=2 Tax=Enterovibrio norvegicus TaxID=188144 RepID=A0ABV4L119_9GAMM|nr:response regulator [Enterovibrio norvegicus]MCC4800193.1 response regulator [Enterovibrio norvegicus]OEE45725.1 diguanylate cyclase [Enterovibrio norvegicus]OEF53374.1 diguanylate cyclase [Enterovibrio norvegicus]OEF65341.1 diguanylate cyclase [Enterovibrio norvegicus]PMH71729.1 diguanylate cyclase [Enterovibrio norvegicus]